MCSDETGTYFGSKHANFPTCEQYIQDKGTVASDYRNLRVVPAFAPDAQLQNRRTVGGVASRWLSTAGLTRCAHLAADFTRLPASD